MVAAVVVEVDCHIKGPRNSIALTSSTLDSLEQIKIDIHSC